MSTIRSAYPALVFAVYCLSMNANSATTPAASSVHDTSGEAIANARVEIYEPVSARERIRQVALGSERRPIAKTTTDAKGRFQIDLGGRPLVELRVEAPGRVPYEADLAPGVEIGAVVLTKAESRCGRVTSGGEAVGGANVILVDGYSGHPLVSVRTRPDGSFCVPDPKSWAVGLVVLHEGHLPKAASASDSLEIALEKGAPVAVTVRGPDGRPAQGAVVTVDGWPVARTDEKGEFEVFAGKSDLVEVSSGALVGRVAPGAGEVRLEPGATLRGVVTGKGGTHPIVRVWAMRQDVDSNRSWNNEETNTLSDSSGSWKIEGLDAGNYSILAHGPGHLSRGNVPPADLSRLLEAERAITVEPIGVVFGRVVDREAKPVPGAILSLAESGSPMVYATSRYGPQVVMSDALGRFVLASPGVDRPFRIAAIRRGYAAGRSQPLTGKAGDRIEAGPVVLERGIEIHGRVVDENGKPLAGAAIAAIEGSVPRASFRAFAFAKEMAIDWLFRAGGDGKFTIILAAGPHELGFHSAGKMPFFMGDYQVRPAADPIEVTLSPGSRIQGKAMDSRGTPLPGLLVALLQNGEPVGRGETGDDGSFQFEDLEAGPYSLLAINRGLERRPEQVVEAPDENVVLVIGGGLELPVRVIDARSGSAIEGARVEAELRGRTDESGAGTRFAQPKGDGGTYVIGGLEPGAVVVQVTARGYRPGKSAEIRLAPDEPIEEIRIALERGVSLSGTVRDSEGKPVAGAYVTPGEENESHSAGGDRFSTVATDDAGQFEIDALTVGETPIVVRKAGFVTLREVVAVGTEGGNRAFVLSHGERIAGVVVDPNGKPVPEALVSASTAALGADDQSTRTEENGSFRLTGLVRGRYSLEVRHERFDEKQLEDLDLQTAGRLVIRLEPKKVAIIRGTVKGAGAQKGDLLVMVSGERGNAEGEVDAEGGYRVENAPAGEVSVQVLATGDSGSGGRLKRVSVPAGAEMVVDFDLATGFRIEGSVTKGGQPLNGTWVWFSREDGLGTTQTRTDGRGHFRAEGLEAGEWQVRVSSYEIGRSEPRSVSFELSGDRTLNIDLTGGGLSGRVTERREGKGIGGAHVSIEKKGGSRRDSSAAKSDAEGRFVLSDLEPGEYLIRADHVDWGNARGTAMVEANGTAEVALVLEKHEGIRVTLVDARSGQPLSGTVVARDPAGNVVFDGEAQRQGDAVVVPVAPGEYRVSASAAGYATVTAPATTASTELRLPLRPGGSIVVVSSSEKHRKARLIDANGEEYVRCWCNRIAELEIEGKRTVFEHIAAGAYTLVVVQPDGTDSRHSVTVTEGVSVELAID